MTEPWNIELLGRLRARCGETEVNRFRTQKTAALFAYLAYFSARPHPREELAALFWPDDEPDAARNSLRVALNSLRRQLEPPGVPTGAVLIADRANVQLNPAVCVTDVHQFRTVLASVARSTLNTEHSTLLQDAIEIYAGPLLPGFFDEWIEPERTRLAENYLLALRALIRALANERDFPRAIDFAHRALAADPLQEAVHRDLMRLYAATGRQDAAMRQYEECARLLRQEMGVEPDATTREMARQLAAGSWQLAVGSGETDGGRWTVDGGRPTTDDDLAEADAHRPNDLTTQRPADPTTQRPASPHPSGSLPLQFTRFFGRQEEAVRLQEMLGIGYSVLGIEQVTAAHAIPDTQNPIPEPRAFSPEPRLVTLTGPGGTGKTRMAIETARALQGSYPAGAWFVSLAEVTDAERVVPAIASVLHIPPVEADTLERIAGALSGGRSLLVLDNLEQIAAEAGPIIHALLARLPLVTVLATSRRRLAVPSEREFPLPPLAVPPEKPTEPLPEDLIAYPAVQLFVDRAIQARPDFQITVGNASDVAALCRDLEGIPLAVELAAARAAVLSPGQMRERLAERFALLSSRREDKSSRHRSLWAAIDWSYRLLSPPLQQFFAGLSIFRGGWTVDAAERVFDDRFAVDYLGQLRAHSLVFAEENGSGMRCQMLEVIREFAAEQLPADRAETLRERLFDYLLGLAERAEKEIAGPRQRRWLDDLEAEEENLRQALDWAREGRRAEEGLRLAGALWQFWHKRGRCREGREQLVEFLGQAGDAAGEPTRAKALLAAGILADEQGEIGASRGYHQQALELFRATGDTGGMARSVANLAILHNEEARLDLARPLFEEALALYRGIGDAAGAADTLANMGVLARHEGDLIRARACYEEALAAHRESGDRQRAAVILNNLGLVAVEQEDYEGARRLFEESLEIRRALDSKRGIANSLGTLGLVAFKQAGYVRAAALYVESAALFLSLQEAPGVLRGLKGLLDVLLELQRWKPAARICGAIERQLSASSSFANCIDPAEWSQTSERLRDTSLQAAHDAGTRMSLEETVEYADRLVDTISSPSQGGASPAGNDASPAGNDASPAGNDASPPGGVAVCANSKQTGTRRLWMRPPPYESVMLL